MTARIFATILFLAITVSVKAEDLAPDNIGETRVTNPADDTHPVFSSDTHWTADVLVAIAGLFLAAAVIGPIVRAEAPATVPDAMSHEEDPAVDRHG